MCVWRKLNSDHQLSDISLAWDPVFSFDFHHVHCFVKFDIYLIYYKELSFQHYLQYYTRTTKILLCLLCIKSVVIIILSMADKV